MVDEQEILNERVRRAIHGIRVLHEGALILGAYGARKWRYPTEEKKVEADRWVAQFKERVAHGEDAKDVDTDITNKITEHIIKRYHNDKRKKE